MIFNEKAKKRILAIASGKGGVGKTMLASNIAMRLAANGQETVVIDLDLGGSNLHSHLGMRNTNLGIGNLFSDSKLQFEDIIIESPIAHLRFVPGDVLVTGVSNFTTAQREYLIDKILKLDAEYIILDLGSGTTSSVVDFFLLSNSGFVVTTPQAPSVLNAYSLLKNATFRYIQQCFADNKRVTTYLSQALKEKRPGATPTIREIVRGIEEKDARAGKKAEECAAQLQPKVILNMARSPEDLSIAESLRNLVQKNLQVNLECLGVVYFDQSVVDSVENLEPYTEVHPETTVSREIERIVQKIIQSESFPYMPLDLESYKDTYELAQIEAENDLLEMKDAVTSEQDLSNIETAELIAIISDQKRQIRELQGTLRMLTMKQE